MKKKRAGTYIIIAGFFVVLCLSHLGWAMFRTVRDTTNYENRELAEFPTLSVANYPSFSEDFEAYFNDHLPFRTYMITLNNAMDYFIFRHSASPRVVLGKDNWLFYSDASDGDPMASYMGWDLYSEEELEMIAQKFVHIDEVMRDVGKEFVLFIAPNKERIYSEYVPDEYGEPADYYRAVQLVQYLRDNTDVRVVYPYEELMQAKALGVPNLYQKTDTHWNNLGGYVGSVALLKELGIEMPSIDSETIQILPGENTSGDLAAILSISRFLKFADVVYQITGYETYPYETLDYDFGNVYHYTAPSADPRSIYVYRDSYSDYMADVIGSQFSESYLRYADTYTYEDFLQQDADIFVFETVERYLSLISAFSLEGE